MFLNSSLVGPILALKWRTGRLVVRRRGGGVFACDEHTSFALLVLNEADTFKSISILIYQHTEQCIYTRKGGLMPMVIIEGAERNIHKRRLRKSKFTNFSIKNFLNGTTLAYSIKV